MYNYHFTTRFFLLNDNNTLFSINYFLDFNIINILCCIQLDSQILVGMTKQTP